ncbi:MAG: PepSY domain-containing protein [Pirellulaceae bacterium]
MSKNWNWWSRKLHRWGAILTALPLLLVILSGLLLQVKKQSDWVQPPTQRGIAKDVQPELAWPTLLDVAKSVPEAEVGDWSDIDRLDVRPGKGIVKLQSKNRWELQIDLQEGKLLSSKYRRSDIIESLHDGSFFSDAAKLWVFLPNGLVLLGLWLSGAWLWYLPLSRKRSKQRK